MEIKIFIVILFLTLSAKSFAQVPSKEDTVLYLLFEEEYHYKRPNSRDVDPKTEEWISVVRFAIENSNFYEGYPLEFVSVKKDLIDTIALEQINDYPIINLEELTEFISQNYRKAYIGFDGSDYFDRLKKIYIVEKDEEKGVATIAEVKLDIAMDAIFEEDFKNSSNRIDDFLSTKEEKLTLLWTTLNPSEKDIINFSFSFDEIDRMEELYKKQLNDSTVFNEAPNGRELFFIYFGEAFMHHAGGNWEICTTKGDPRFGQPIILNWGTKDHIGISPNAWLLGLEDGDLIDEITGIIKDCIRLDKM